MMTAILAMPAQAEAPPSRYPGVDANVFSVVSQTWPSDRQGVIRIISLAHGFDPVSTEVVVQWLERLDDSGGNWGIAASKTLVEPGFSVFGPPRLSVLEEAIRVDLEGVQTYPPDKRIRSCFTLYPDRRADSVDCGK